MSQKNFRVEDMKMKVAIAKDSKSTKNKDKAPAPAAETTSQDPNAVPDGTTAEVLAWVGDDEARAQAALDKENADESPRKGLTSELEKILEADEEPEE